MNKLGKVLVTGGAGFVGSHVCEYFSKQGARVVALDNLSRARLLGKASASTKYNLWQLNRLKNVSVSVGDITNFDFVKEAVKGVDAIIHTASQTAVTTSVLDPYTDFRINALGTFHVLEAARISRKKPAVLICSTNKVYGENVNQVPIVKKKKRYEFSKFFANGIPENFGIDLCEHSPYGCSKLTADLYGQDFARLYGLRVGVFRMSCIYGTRQFGVEDQGWVSWFVIAAITGRPVTIYGDGKQIRDLLWVEDLVQVYDKFLNSTEQHVVLNIGGGPQKTLSLLELIDLLKAHGFSPKINYGRWRPSDQKVYVSDIRKAKKVLNWSPKVSPVNGVSRLIHWVSQNRVLFK